MLEKTAEELAYPTMTCPMTGEVPLKTSQKYFHISARVVHYLYRISQQSIYSGRPFKREDILEVVNASSGFSASGQVEVKKYRPSMN
jgi:hypothetical protein